MPTFKSEFGSSSSRKPLSSLPSHLFPSHFVASLVTITLDLYFIFHLSFSLFYLFLRLFKQYNNIISIEYAILFLCILFLLWSLLRRNSWNDAILVHSLIVPWILFSKTLLGVSYISFYIFLVYSIACDIIVYC